MIERGFCDGEIQGDGVRLSDRGVVRGYRYAERPDAGECTRVAADRWDTGRLNRADQAMRAVLPR